MKVQLNNDAGRKAHSSRLINLHRRDDNELNRAIEREREKARKVLAEQKAAAAACKAIAAAESSVSSSLPVLAQSSSQSLPMIPIKDLPVDEIALATSEAITAIRTATDPADIASQLKSLQQFAKNLKENPDVPEMLELSATIEKFVAVAKKSTGAKAEAKQKRVKKVIVVDQQEAKSQKAEQKSPKVEQKEVKACTIKQKSAAQRKVAQSRVVKEKSGVKVKIEKSKPKLVVSASKNNKPLKKAPVKTSRIALPKKLQEVGLSKSKQVAGHKDSAKKSTRALHREDKALKQALEKVAAMDDEQREIVRKHHKHDGVKVLVAMACAVLCVVGIVWVVSSNNPDVSVRVAAMQTGVQATYPSYIPRDFTLKDISSENGKITLTFYNSTSGVSFTMTEEKSSWDSAALERNYVKLNYGTNYEVTHEQGVTVYIKGSSAAWVNGGVLYKIDADAGILTKKQLRNIVTSM